MAVATAVADCISVLASNIHYYLFLETLALTMSITIALQNSEIELLLCFLCHSICHCNILRGLLLLCHVLALCSQLIWLCCDKYFHCFPLIFEGIHNGVKDCLIDLLKTLHLQLHVFSSVEEAFKIIIWYDS